MMVRSTVLTLIATAIVASACSGAMKPRSVTPTGMAWIPGDTFAMGCADCGMPDAQPVHAVAVGGFWIDTTPVTNEQFDAFVKATG